MKSPFIKVAILLSVLLSSNILANQQKPNVLFLMIDDLRVQHGPYARNAAITPSMDALAAQGVVFNRAYSNVPICGASRASMLTGLYPTKNRFLLFNAASKDAPGIPSIPKTFKDNGYHTVSLGKVFNNYHDSIDAWSQPEWRPGKHYGKKLPKKQVLKHRAGYQSAGAKEAFAKAKLHGPAYESADVDDYVYDNGLIAKRAMLELTQAKKRGKPFFLAMGLRKPHLPFNAPKKYWDLYDRNNIILAANSQMAKDAPIEATHQWNELRNYLNMPKADNQPMPDDLAKDLIHGYLAATSYSDALVGDVLAHLQQLELDKNTIVILWGDHGWSLGEHGLWAKHSNFNIANQIPIIVRAPQIAKNKSAYGLIESVDIYPTLVELANLPKPKHLQGTSFVEQLNKPERAGKDAIFLRYKNADSIRTEQYFYTQWFDENGKVSARMLYDHNIDPDEMVNIAELATSQAIVKRLQQQLEQHIASL
ncbi:sulfatase [Thalassomonas sp. M1454]|uniref:sulfatase n=1 Tax=Thalassomonas sp. M1454 TaxID=2594477 RepID=UPI00118101A4|nr:sulfatase [Thalassomonas sp. M1454]TRX54956.1 sulfatase [Thalassomonas sp. M1454]